MILMMMAEALGMAGHCRKMLYGIEKRYKQTAKRVGIHATLVLTAPVGSKTGEYSDHVFCPSTFFCTPTRQSPKKDPNIINVTNLREVKNHSIFTTTAMCLKDLKLACNKHEEELCSVLRNSAGAS